jgi:hypothetical protein
MGGVGPWTFPNVQPTLQPGGVGPWTFQKVQPTLREGGGWTLDFKKERIHYLGGKWYKVTLV